MPDWIHQRRDHIKKQNPGMDDSMAWALATEQAYAIDKAPKEYGTEKGRKRSKKKYKKSPSKYEQKADPPKKKKSKKKSFIFNCRFLTAMLIRDFPQEAQLLNLAIGD